MFKWLHKYLRPSTPPASIRDITSLKYSDKDFLDVIIEHYQNLDITQLNGLDGVYKSTRIVDTYFETLSECLTRYDIVTDAITEPSSRHVEHSRNKSLVREKKSLDAYLDDYLTDLPGLVVLVKDIIQRLTAYRDRRALAGINYVDVFYDRLNYDLLAFTHALSGGRHVD